MSGNGNGHGKPPQDLLPQPPPKRRPKAPVTQLHPASSRRRDELKLEATFLSAMAEHFAEHGQTAIERVYNRSPEAYLRVAAKLLPPRSTAEPLGADDIEALVGLAHALRERRDRAIAEAQAGTDAPSRR